MTALRDGEILSAHKGISEIFCASGKVWITAAGCETDMFLASGERRDMAGFRDICVQALEDSRVVLVPVGRAERANAVPMIARVAEN
jgi:hypothetical protein